MPENRPVSTEWLAAQPWAGARSATMGSIAVVAEESITARVRWMLLAVDLTDDQSNVVTPCTYQVFWDGERDVAATPDVLNWVFPDLAARRVVPMAGEQSNTSVIVDDDVVVKFFRRVSEAPNPDVESVRRLWSAGFRHVAEPLGEWSRDGRDLAVARRLAVGARDGWGWALDPGSPGSPGAPGGIVDALRDLGQVIAEMHVALAAAFGVTSGDGAAWADAQREQAARCFREVDPGLQVYADRLAALDDVGVAMRIHGDLHLGQVLWRPEGWLVLDFEGEPARPVAERIAPSSPLRDVAGMLRSLAYAEAVGRHRAGWADEAEARFRDGYFGVAELGPLLAAEVPTVLDAFIVDKAMYELAYERSMRPEWEWVPREALAKMSRSGPPIGR